MSPNKFYIVRYTQQPGISPYYTGRATLNGTGFSESVGSARRYLSIEAILRDPDIPRFFAGCVAGFTIVKVTVVNEPTYTETPLD